MALVAYEFDSNSESEDDDSNLTENINSVPPSTIKNNGKIESVHVITTNSFNQERIDVGLNSNQTNPPEVIDKIDELPTFVENDAATANAQENFPKSFDFHANELSSNSEPSNLFSTLPPKKTAKDIEEGQVEDFIPKSSTNKKSNQKVKITIPSLSQFADEDVPPLKKYKPSSKGSGLISILPPVKGTVMTAKSFIPNSVANKKVTPAPLVQDHKLVPHVIKKKADAKKAALLQKIKEDGAKAVLSDAESDDDIEIPATFDDEMWEKVCGRPKPKPKPVRELIEPPSQVINIAPEPEKQYDGLDNQAFKELVGKSKRPIGNIKLIDIHEDEVLSNTNLLKSLTCPELAPKPEIEDPVDPTRRKKHHITYLAQQAKANEQELQNAWAAGRNNKMATRAKYGF